MENEIVEVANSNPVAEQELAPVEEEQVVAAPMQTTATAPTPSDADKQIAELRAELRNTQIKASLSEHHLIPLDRSLVLKLINERAESDNLDIDGAISSLYKSHPYLFKSNVKQTPVAQKSNAESDTAYAKALIDGAVKRIRRTTINPITH